MIYVIIGMCHDDDKILLDGLFLSIELSNMNWHDLFDRFKQRLFQLFTKSLSDWFGKYNERRNVLWFNKHRCERHSF